MVHELKDIVAVLAEADPEDKRAIYDELGVNTTRTDEYASAQEAVYLGFVSEGGLVSRRDAIRLSRTVSLAA